MTAVGSRLRPRIAALLRHVGVDWGAPKALHKGDFMKTSCFRVDEGTAVSNPLLAAEVVLEAGRTLRRLRLVRGASRRTRDRIRRTATLLLAVCALVGISSLEPAPARAITDVGTLSRPNFVDIDGDGDSTP
jgi:hypothetical protein